VSCHDLQRNLSANSGLCHWLRRGLFARGAWVNATALPGLRQSVCVVVLGVGKANNGAPGSRHSDVIQLSHACYHNGGTWAGIEQFPGDVLQRWLVCTCVRVCPCNLNIGMHLPMCLWLCLGMRFALGNASHALEFVVLFLVTAACM